MQCSYHLCKNDLTGRQIKYCSSQCKSKQNVIIYRKRIKEKAVAYKGSCCEVCGYDRYVGALQFHHRDPSKKDFSISKSGNCHTWENVKAELDKCDMLCANCHAERHAGLV